MTARQFAGSLGLEPGTAKDVAKKAGIEMDWDKVEHVQETQIELQPRKMRLPRLVEADPRGPEVLMNLSTQTRPLWSAGVKVPTVHLSAELAEALGSAERSGRVIRGLEGAERALAAEERGLRAAQGVGRPDVRISRLLLLADDGSERFYRHVETLLRRHGPRVLAVRLDADADALGERLFGPGRLARLLMIVHKEAVSTILLAMAGQGVPAGGGPDGRE